MKLDLIILGTPVKYINKCIAKLFASTKNPALKKCSPPTKNPGDTTVLVPLDLSAVCTVPSKIPVRQKFLNYDLIDAVYSEKLALSSPPIYRR